MHIPSVLLFLVFPSILSDCQQFRMSRNIQDLSLTISNAVNTLTTLLQEDKVPAPSFSPAKDNEPAASKDANEIVDRILDATTELHDLLINPAQLIRTYSSVSCVKRGFLHSVCHIKS